MSKSMQSTLLKKTYIYFKNKYFYVIHNFNVLIKNFKEGKIWQKLKELTEEPDKKEVILNLVVKEEEELNKLGKNKSSGHFFF